MHFFKEKVKILSPEGKVLPQLKSVTPAGNLLPAVSGWISKPCEWDLLNQLH
jgi:hypothetical protein